MKRHASMVLPRVWEVRATKDSMNSTKIFTIETSKNSRKRFTKNLNIHTADHMHSPESI